MALRGTEPPLAAVHGPVQVGDRVRVVNTGSSTNWMEGSITALTANSSPQDRERCIAAGMCDFVDKPVRKFELARVLKRWVTRPLG
mgnify:CR=1 FL=1